MTSLSGTSCDPSCATSSKFTYDAMSDVSDAMSDVDPSLHTCTHEHTHTHTHTHEQLYIIGSFLLKTNLNSDTPKL